MTKGQEAQGAHQIKEPLIIESGVEARYEKENILRKVVERAIHQDHLHLVQKVVHLSKNGKKVSKKKKHHRIKISTSSSSESD